MYLVTRFPTVTETFVVNEWWELSSRFPLEFAALVKQRQPALHERTRRLLPRVLFVGLLSPGTVRANAAFLVREPRLYAGTLLTLLRGSHRTPMGGKLKGAVAFWKAVRLAQLSQELGVRHVHAHFVNQPATAAWVIHRLTGVSFSITAHANDLFAGPAMLETKVREAAFVATISEYNVAFLRQRIPVGGRIEVVHCGVELDRFAFHERSTSSRLLCVARLVDTKGHADLLRAFAALADDLPRLRLDLVGEGPEAPRLAALCRELGISDRVRFHGPLPSDEVGKLMQESDLFVLASIPHRSGAMDGIPVALMEAMASGVPVVTTGLSGIPELVSDGETGLLVPPGRPDALAAAIRRLVEDRDLARRLAHEGRHVVGERFSLVSEVDRLGDLLEQVASGGASVRGAAA